MNSTEIIIEKKKSLVFEAPIKIERSVMRWRRITAKDSERTRGPLEGRSGGCVCVCVCAAGEG